MRLSIILLVATMIVFLANGNIVAASDSTLASPDAVVSLGKNQHVVAEKRFLRKYDTLDEEEESDDTLGEEESDDNEEDRLLSAASQAKALTNRIHRTAVFRHLERAVGTPSQAASMLSDDLYKMYHHWFYFVKIQSRPFAKAQTESQSVVSGARNDLLVAHNWIGARRTVVPAWRCIRRLSACELMQGHLHFGAPPKLQPRTAGASRSSLAASTLDLGSTSTSVLASAPERLASTVNALKGSSSLLV
ncbi:unnamed protein product [Phytophthora fragariaefolia]|uniref:RxLR effector protein n=1 Tax=Phytophthora fragariaefolia TaxID=1490495 RepID=A0A9W6XJX7_9STRA|nr:unnamed protein product [Phytophthora fragariaefolia]